MEFTDSQYMTAREKDLVLKAWVRFLANGLRPQDFTERLYHHLSQHCSFIAHYNCAGFYQVYFGPGQAEATKLFLRQFDPAGDCRSAEYGGTWWLQGDYEDINKAMCKTAGPYIEGVMDDAMARQRQTDLAQAKRLLVKWGITLPGGV